MAAFQLHTSLPRGHAYVYVAHMTHLRGNTRGPQCIKQYAFALRAMMRSHEGHVCTECNRSTIMAQISGGKRTGSDPLVAAFTNVSYARQVHQLILSTLAFSQIFSCVQKNMQTSSKFTSLQMAQNIRLGLICCARKRMTLKGRKGGRLGSILFFVNR